MRHRSTCRRCPPWPSALSLRLLLGNFLAEQMARHFITADQWHSAIVALQAPLLAAVCMCVSVRRHTHRKCKCESISVWASSGSLCTVCVDNFCCFCTRKETLHNETLILTIRHVHFVKKINKTWFGPIISIPSNCSFCLSFDVLLIATNTDDDVIALPVSLFNMRKFNLSSSFCTVFNNTVHTFTATVAHYWKAFRL